MCESLWIPAGTNGGQRRLSLKCVNLSSVNQVPLANEYSLFSQKCRFSTQGGPTPFALKSTQGHIGSNDSMTGHVRRKGVCLESLSHGLTRTTFHMSGQQAVGCHVSLWHLAGCLIDALTKWRERILHSEKGCSLQISWSGRCVACSITVKESRDACRRRQSTPLHHTALFFLLVLPSAHGFQVGLIT